MKDTRKWLSPVSLVKIVIAIAVLLCGFLRVTGLGMLLRHDLAVRMIEGSEAHLVNAGQVVPIYRDLATFSYVAHLDPEKASDMARLEHVSESDAIVYVPSGTRVRTLRATVRYAYVEIIDGAQAGVMGYVPAAFVQE